jgi:hypothetical protein
MGIFGKDRTNFSKAIANKAMIPCITGDSTPNNRIKIRATISGTATAIKWIITGLNQLINLLFL